MSKINKTTVNEMTINETTVNKIVKVFQLPITYNSHKKEVAEHIQNDLELVKTQNEEEEKPLYQYLFQPKHCLGKKMLPAFSRYYTTDIQYLKDTQTFLKTYNPPSSATVNYAQTESFFNEIKKETGFCEKYLYIDWDFCKFLNKNTTFLQCMSLYNVASPILSLFLPVIMLIIPFIIIKIKGIELNMNEYITILKMLLANHAICKIFTKFNEVDIQQKMYLAVSAAFYVFSIYQNILICVRFYSNMKKIHDYLFHFREYIQSTLFSMKYHLEVTGKLSSYTDFHGELEKQMNILSTYNEKLEKITSFKLSFSKLFEIGHIMQTFYELYEDKEYEHALLYSFGYNGYVDNIQGFIENINNHSIHKATFQSKGKEYTKPIFKDMYYPKFIENIHSVTKNDCNLHKNIIISGPNASGKTTLLKSTLINILISQQFGYGCYSSAKLTPYDFIHCYLNIPDTSGRDSLFQAEARRCKEIIDCVEENKEETHFCIFDELYSGTNPEEAVSSAFAFMKYIVKNEKVTCMLTTHYMKLCKRLAKNKYIKNYHMNTIHKNNHYEYTYILTEGISTVKGGVKVLIDLNYPKEMIDRIR
jgi:hypothetical protein